MATSVNTKYDYIIHDENLEIFGLIWLDAQVNSDQHNLDAQKQLRAIINHLKTFDNANQCQNYIIAIPRYYHLVLILSGQLGKEIVPRIHHLDQVSTIYVYCRDRAGNEEWAKKFHKVR